MKKKGPKLPQEELSPKLLSTIMPHHTPKADQDLLKGFHSDDYYTSNRNKNFMSQQSNLNG